MSELLIRKERPEDFRTMETIMRDAFWDVYRPGCNEHFLIHKLRKNPSYMSDFSFVAEQNGVLCGGIYYAMASVVKTNGQSFMIPTFGPIGVAPAMQKQGIGSALIRHTIPMIQEAGFEAVVIYGNPAYYGRFGFQPGKSAGIASSNGEFYDALQILRFYEGNDLTGRFMEGDAYQLDDEEAYAFDAEFPPREKHVLPTQL